MKELFHIFFYDKINSPKNLFTKHNFQQKTYLPNIFSAKKNLMKQTEKVHQAFCIKHVLILKNQKKNSLNKHFFPACNWLIQSSLTKKKMFYYKNYLKQKYIFSLGAFHILCQTPREGGSKKIS